MTYRVASAPQTPGPDCLSPLTLGDVCCTPILTPAAAHRLFPRALQHGNFSRWRRKPDGQMESAPSSQHSAPGTHIHAAAVNTATHKEDKNTQKRPAPSPAASPLAKGPVSKKQLAADEDDLTMTHTYPQSQSLAAFPALDQPASEFTIKEMLLSLKKLFAGNPK